MVADARRLAAAATALALGLAPAAVGAVQRTNLADLCTEGGAGPVGRIRLAAPVMALLD